MRVGARTYQPVHPLLQVVLHQWPALIFVPAVLTLIAALVLVTGWFERRDERRAVERWVRERVPVPRPPTTADPRPWRRRTSCACSWHIRPDALAAPAAVARVHQDVAG